MEDIIIYGLGNEWIRNKEVIEKHYHVIGYYDKNRKKMLEYSPFFENKSQIVERNENILITSSRYRREIVNELKDSGIQEDRIISLDELEIGKLHWNKRPIGGVSYSGEYEDWLIDSIIQKLDIKYCEMKYVELGVMDPIISSNTYYFYERGASGVLVEANPNLIPRIKKIRPNDIVINKAIYEADNVLIPFYISNEPGLSSVYEDHLEKVDTWKGIGWASEIKIETIKINTLLSGMPHIDLMSIDLEGYDYIALSMMDFNKYRPKILIAELNWFDLSERESYQNIVNLLYSMNYELYFQNDYNGIFIDKKLVV